MSRDASDAFIDRIESHWDEHGWGLWAVEVPDVAPFIGYVGLEEIVSFTVPQNERSWRVMERIGLVRDPAGDFDHPRVDPVAYPQLVRHVFYRLRREDW